ncbi:MAG: ACP S-malonyltransferase [Fibrobacter sp.]|nr:ACP S-malonyltransferase [Fibrobacter sp.]
MKKTAFLFPGQGSQAVGMFDAMEKYGEAVALLKSADEILDFNLSAILKNGPAEVLCRTEIAQPAIFTTSMALWTNKKGWHDGLFAGHSLGEFSAACAAGVFSFEEGLRLVATRGRLMARACQQRAGKMLAVLGQPQEVVEQALDRFRGAITSGPVLVIANINGPKQIVVSGDASAIDDFAAFLAAEKIRTVFLKVAGAFHSPLMESALPEWNAALDAVTFNEPTAPLIDNVTGAVVTSAAELKENLRRQLVSPVQWVKTLETAKSLGVTAAVEIGPGAVLTGLCKKWGGFACEPFGLAKSSGTV